VNDPPTDAVAAICGCSQITQFFALGGDCSSTLNERLALATPDARANWLKTYATADCSLCSNAKICFYTAPACTASGNPCEQSAECCSAPQYPLTACPLASHVCK
jgi:hypothetical protein